ncbi:hypothetical protein JNUCC1_03356 [Lentibacillus sp. JNUCC-1]|uniref:major tail protein n=1 Tax=Lentibacillus sp. JNUCC-1 TaxID=2654513 RepID=UPI0012E83F0D|nr:major tail protein [Lentibacillus sp. JNUCC-1]MUV39478.1 hypothetical protein [Lentibacillus sp. JNUCC-1]
MYQTGLKNFHFAPLTSDDDTGTVYDTPSKLSEAVSASVEPNTATGRHFGDNEVVATASKLNYVTVNIDMTTLTAEDEALLLGKTLDDDGVLKEKGGKPPYGAFGFEVTMDDGSSEFWWLLKGKFQEPTRSQNTETDSIEFGTPSMSGEFIRRKSDKEWKFVGNESNTGFTSGGTWFDKVYEKPVGP